MKHLMKRVLSLLLCLSMIIAWVPAGILQSSAAVLETTGRVADPNTMDQWQDYFSDLSTEFAGGVWTDKSVMTDKEAFGNLISMDDPDNNFLIALSAMAANQQIMGYSSAPVDVMLVLDVSGSMDDNRKAESMVYSANLAIHSLLSQNNNNRIGVVLYSGTRTNQGATATTVILPLDHYTTTSSTTITVPNESGNGTTQKTVENAYLAITNNNSSPDVYIPSGVKNSDKETPSAEREVVGATYIQKGLYEAWLQFQQVTDTVVPAGQVQAGAQRTPVMILMSDGQPTLSTPSYNLVGNADLDYGYGSEDTTTNETVFFTQLTAAFVKGKMQAHYGTAAKFYTVGLGTGNSQYATAVLNPSTSNTTLQGYWTNFNDPDKLESNGYVEVIADTDNRPGRDNSLSVYKDSNVGAMNYVDLYKLAEDTDELLEAFQTIVDSIELDAAGHVTLVEDIGADMSGYVTITDELGVFMEVKDLKGLVLGNTLFTGHELAKSLQEANMGTQQNPTDYGNEFISTVRERLGIESVSDAQNLVIAAYADGQLAYDAATEEYSNYIGWYSNDAGDYLGFWDKDTGITAEGAPEGATWINKSYGYLGTANDSDMMHVVVMLSTHIESGMQVMQYKIPASLLPMVTYQVELEGSDPTKMTSITRTNASPLRLVYEVGLQEGINSVNVADKVNAAIEAGWGHSHINDDGSYAFYTNKWGAEHGDSTVDYNDPLNHEVAQSHFHPAVGNDRYYYTEDTPVYVKNGNSYSLYNGAAAPAGDGYYRAYHYYTANGYTTEYLPMSEYALQQAAAKGQQEDGYWYIPEGAIFQQIDRFHMLKESNPTGTLEYFDYPVVVDVGDKYDTYAFLGNNGKLSIIPAQGIRLTKTVTETVEGASDSFTFDITLSQAVEAPLVTDADGNELTGYSVNGNVITVTLKAGETVCVTGIPTGVTYTVTERKHADYVGSSQNATGTVQSNTIHPVDFVNVPKGYGNLIVSKDVDHPYTNVPEALTNKEFTINVTLSGEDVANAQFAIAGTDPVQYITTDANGSFSVTLKDNGSLTLVGLPEGTTFTTSETLDAEAHKGFSMDESRSILSGTIVKDTAVQTHVVNVYAPSSPVATIDVVGTKTLTDEADAFDWTGKSFTIRLEQYDTATGAYVVIDETEVTEGSLNYKFEDKLTFNAIGTYYYKVSEVIPETRLEGMSYDATVGRFEVQVTDNDVDGQLEFVVYDFDTREQITGTELNYTYTKNFENIHTTDAVATEFNVYKNVVDTHNTGTSGAGYLFELYEVVDGVTAETATYSMRTVLVDGKGQATFHIPVTKSGVRTFILKEATPLEADRIPGMTYDSTQYTVTVTTDSQDGKLLEPVVTVTKNGQSVDLEELVFTNTINLEPLILEPYVTKTLNGREPLNESEFTFNIVQTDGSFATAIEGGYSDTVSVGEGDKYFEKITVTQVGTYYFRTTEVIGTTGGMTYDNSIYHVTVNVTAEDGKLVKDVTYVKVGEGVPSTETDFVQFTNTYVNTDTEQVILSGTKALTGRRLVTGEFSFQLKQGETVLQTVTNRADGSFVFEPLTYTAADVGTHTYTVVEVNDGKGGVTYDQTVYTVTVKVEDNGMGELVVTTTGADAMAFNNSYSAKPVSVGFSGTKSWYNTDLGQNKPLSEGDFTFVLYATDESYSYQGAQVASTTNSASGSFSFGIRYETAGHYYYLLREQITDDATIGYDTAVYQIHVAVYDNGLGNMVGSVAEITKVGTGDSTISFRNTYTPEPVELSIVGDKTLTGRDMEDGEFSFQLIQDGSVLETVTNADGKFTFSAITYDKTGTYTYQVKELIPTQAENNVYQGVTYDTTVFDVTVTVSDEDGALTAAYTASVNGEQKDLAFANEYGIQNFTDFNLSGNKQLWLGESTIALGDRTFRFAILDDKGVVLQTVSSDENGKFSFVNVPLTETGINTFKVVELDDGLSGITYDDTEFTVTVDVVLSQGDLIAGLPVVKLGEDEAELTFNNTYTLAATELALQVEKVLEGKKLQADQFSFELRDKDNKVLQTVKNTDTGTVRFDAIEYTSAGTYTYTVNEVIPTGVTNGIGYDDSVIRVTVVVTDNGDGTLNAKATYQDLPVFTNTYTVTGDPVVDISGTKTLTGKTLSDGDFTFVLTDDEGNTTEVGNKGGSFTFEDVKLDGLGEHRFTVSEKNTGKGGITYDERVYTVTVTVTDDGFGGMTVGAPVVTYHGVSAHLAFANSYNVTGTSVTISGTKELVGGGLKAGDFTFDLYETDSSYTVTGQPIASTSNGADGSFSFNGTTVPELAYSEETVRYYVLAENSDGPSSEIRYDETAYQFKVTVTDNTEGQLNAVVECVNGDKDNIRFLNVPHDEIVEKTVTYSEDTASIDGKKVYAGDTLKYTISYKNYTSKTLDVTVTDTIPAHTSFVSADNDGSYANGKVTWNLQVAAGETVKVSFQVSVDANIGAQKIRNQATVVEGSNTYTTNEVTNYTVVDEVEKDVFYPADTTVSIDGRKVYAGEILQYAISYENTSSEKVTVTISDNIPAYTAYVNGSATNGGTYADGKVTWTLDVDAGKSVRVYFQVKVDENAGAVTIPNQATVVEGSNSYTTNEVTNYTVVDEVEKDVFYAADTTVSIDGRKVYAGEILQYAISYENTSSEKVTVTISDNIPAHTAYVNGSATNGGTYADGKVTWTLEVDAGKSVSVYFQVKVDENAGAVTIPNHATVVEGSNSYTTNEVTNYTVVDQVEKDVFNAADTTVSIDGKKVNVGDALVYTISYTNTAAEKAAVTITDKLPEHTSFVSADHGGQFADGMITWSLDVEAGKTVTVSFQVTVDMDNVVVSNQAFILEGKNSYQTNVVYTHTVEDTIVKDVFQANAPTVSIDGNKVEVGDTLLYTITYSNMQSQGIALQITDTVPQYTTYVDGSADFGGTFADGVVTWNLELAAWEIKTVSFKVTVDEAEVTLTNQAQSYDGTNTLDTNVVTNHTIEDVTDKDVFQAGDLTVSLDGKKVNVGDTLVYTISYRNILGQDAKLTITDKLPAYTSFVSADNGGVFADGIITWNLDVPAWQDVTVSFTVTVDAANQIIPNTATILDGVNEYNTNTVISHTVEDPTEKDVFQTNAPTVSIDGEKVNVGDTLVYTITYRNASADALTATITDAIPAHTTYVDGSADLGGAFADGIVTWTLDVPAWSFVTVSFQVTVDDADAVISNKATVLEGTNSYDTNTVVNHTVEEPLGKDVYKLEEPTVSIDGQRVMVGDILVYTITYRNMTAETVDLQLADRIPQHTSYIEGSADHGGTLEEDVIFWRMDLEAWDSVTVSFKVKVNDMSATIENTAYSYDGVNEYQSNTVTNTTPDPIPETGDCTNVQMLASAMGFSALGILVLLAVLVLNEKRGILQ